MLWRRRHIEPCTRGPWVLNQGRKIGRGGNSFQSLVTDTQVPPWYTCTLYMETRDVPGLCLWVGCPRCTRHVPSTDRGWWRAVRCREHVGWGTGRERRTTLAGCWSRCRSCRTSPWTRTPSWSRPTAPRWTLSGGFLLRTRTCHTSSNSWTECQWCRQMLVQPVLREEGFLTIHLKIQQYLIFSQNFVYLLHNWYIKWWFNARRSLTQFPPFW